MRRVSIIILVTGTMVVTTTIAAFAAHRPADADQEDVVVEWSFDEATSHLTWWLAPQDDEEPLVCPDVDVADDGCHVVEIVPPGGGEPNHGTFVSAFVHSLKELDLDVPRGWLVRQVAQSDLGKGDTSDEADEAAEVEEPDADSDSDSNAKGRPEHAGPPDHAKDKNKDKGEGGGDD